MSGFDGYDQWKTASPYDDYDDEHCAYCGADLPDDVTDLSDAVENAIMDGYCNPECQVEGDKGNISPNWGKPHFSEAQHERYMAISCAILKWDAKHVEKPGKLEDLLEFLPEGDFDWEGEPGDWNVYCCGEGDCEQQWHLSAYWENIKRVDGKLSIECYSVDSSGDTESDGGWEEGESFADSDVPYCIGEGRMNSHFKGWAQYWLASARSGDDPCDQLLRTVAPGEWIDFCLDAAADHVKYLTMKRAGPFKMWWRRLVNSIKRIMR